ncbi:MAG TPA: hypothetical protein VFS39_10375 [Nitrospira sp.]|nr:hypothetical protein [Nitrospira sp.]
MKLETTFQTAEGNQTVPLALQELKTAPFEEQTKGIAELNQGSSAIDRHRAKGTDSER